jgi:hypothetical protein
MAHNRNDGNVADKDQARTPPTLFNRLNERFHFDCDLFATSENTLCDCYFSKDEPKGSIHPHSFVNGDDGVRVCMGNALEQEWFIARYYGNPPYSNPEPYVKKAYVESLKGSIVVLLLPADVSTSWFREYCMNAAEWIIIEGRVKFNNPDGTPMAGSPKFGSIAVVFDRAERERNGYIKTSLMKWK